MTGEIVNHVRFGRGVVTDFAPPRIEVRFDGEGSEARRFAYPEAFSKFLSCESAEADARVKRDLEAAGAASRQQILAKIEQSRQREERMMALRLEEQRKKRADTAKKSAERRKAALEARRQSAENKKQEARDAI